MWGGAVLPALAGAFAATESGGVIYPASATIIPRWWRLVEKILLKYNNVDLEKDTYALLSKALEDWDEEIKKISDNTKELIMKK